MWIDRYRYCIKSLNKTKQKPLLHPCLVGQMKSKSSRCQVFFRIAVIKNRKTHGKTPPMTSIFSAEPFFNQI